MFRKTGPHARAKIKNMYMMNKTSLFNFYLKNKFIDIKINFFIYMTEILLTKHFLYP